MYYQVRALLLANLNRNDEMCAAIQSFRDVMATDRASARAREVAGTTLPERAWFFGELAETAAHSCSSPALALDIVEDAIDMAFAARPHKAEHLTEWGLISWRNNLHGTLSTLYGTKGMALSELGRNEEAVTALQTSLYFEPIGKEYARLGLVYLQMNEKRLAFAHMIKAQELGVDDGAILSEMRAKLDGLFTELGYWAPGGVEGFLPSGAERL